MQQLAVQLEDRNRAMVSTARSLNVGSSKRVPNKPPQIIDCDGHSAWV
jgi:hypothetical protein